MTSSSVLDIEDVRTRVSQTLDQFLASHEELMLSISVDLAPLTDAVVSFLNGGKRLRPAFCYWGWRGAGGSGSDESALIAATSLEFLQACALIHDDVMDASETRRGQPAAHHRFANLHREAQWLGSPENFGVGSAILLGDLCLSWADELLLASGLPVDALQRAKPIYDEMRTELMAGQYLDLLEQARGGGSVERALRVVHYKAAKYTIERPLHLGAAFADASAELTVAYTDYGLPLGEAFQLRDDVLGVFGDPAETGKPAGDDLREGKRTILIALALEKADGAQSATIHRLLGDPALSAADVDVLREIIEATGSLRDTEQRIETLLEQSLSALNNVTMEDEARSALTGLALAATRRKN